MREGLWLLVHVKISLNCIIQLSLWLWINNTQASCLELIFFTFFPQNQQRTRLNRSVLEHTVYKIVLFHIAWHTQSINVCCSTSTTPYIGHTAHTVPWTTIPNTPWISPSLGTWNQLRRKCALGVALNVDCVSFWTHNKIRNRRENKDDNVVYKH